MSLPWSRSLMVSRLMPRVSRVRSGRPRQVRVVRGRRLGTWRLSQAPPPLAARAERARPPGFMMSVVSVSCRMRLRQPSQLLAGHQGLPAQ